MVSRLTSPTSGVAPVVEIEDLTIGYAGRKVVASGLNTTLKQGHLVCLLGANGTGKSTLIRSICGFQPSLAGTIRLRGREVSSINATEMARELSVVLTDRLNIPNATVEEIVGYGRSPYTGFLGRLSKSDKKIVRDSMECCRIAHKRKELIADLSDGERQKAVIAKAMAQDTPLIILDEPTAFLDLPTRVEIMQLLRSLAISSGKSILMSTHDMELALQLSDRLWILHRDGPLDVGSPEDLLLSGAFDNLFGQSSVHFDVKTGLFKVAYSYHSKLAVVGHGFHYTLLRRAFARRGIELQHESNPHGIWLKISNAATNPYSIYDTDEQISSHQSIDELVEQVLLILNLVKTVSQSHENTQRSVD